MSEPASHQCCCPPAALAELHGAYAELEARLGELGVECSACGRCCDFARNGYRLYASHLERAALREGAGPPRLAPDGSCGFLVLGRCLAHSHRPLGCRVFFCDPAHKPREPELCEEFLARLRAITDRYGLPWDYRPLFEEEN